MIKSLFDLDYQGFINVAVRAAAQRMGSDGVCSYCEKRHMNYKHNKFRREMIKLSKKNKALCGLAIIASEALCPMKGDGGNVH